MGHHTRLIRLAHHQGTVLPCKIHLYLVQPDNLYFTAAQRHTPHKEMLPAGTLHIHIRGIGMFVAKLITDDKLIIKSLFTGKCQGIPDPQVIRLKSHDSPE